MIPKVIHYVWFGGKPLGRLEERCIASWKKFLPDYKIMRWDENNFDIRQNTYCYEAYQNKKWAFASDYVRLWALVNYGGIYMDTDVEVIGSFDSFLSLHAFSGFESETMIATGILASEANHPLFQDLLSFYDNRHFIQADGSMDQTTNVTVLTEYLKKRGLTPNNRFQEVSGLSLYPRDYFSPKSHSTGKLYLTDNSVAIHHFNGSWIDEDDREINEVKHRILRYIPFVPTKVAGLMACVYYGFHYHDFSLLSRYFRRFLDFQKKFFK